MNKKFIEKLSKDDWQYFIENYIVNKDICKNVDIHFQTTSKDVWDKIDKVKIYVHMKKELSKTIIPSILVFEVNDFTFKLCDGFKNTNYSKKLHLFLTSLFEEDYTRSLYSYRINKAKKETEDLLRENKARVKKYKL